MSTSDDSGLTAEQWELLTPLFPLLNQGADLEPLNTLSVLNANLYLVITDCQWLQPPHVFPAGQRCIAIFNMER